MMGRNKHSKKLKEHFNTHLNRFESNSGHRYKQFEYGACPYLGANPISARIKCRLVHLEGNSIVLPEFIFLENNGWIQPLFFTSPVFINVDTANHMCDFFVDIQEGQTIRVRIYSTGFIKELSDKSHLYKCEVYGPADIEKYSSGDYFEDNGQMQLNLFHHTDDKGFDGINASKSFWSSKWNYRGNKECINYNFVYFTHIPEIKYDSDLVTVAMSAEGKIDYGVDNFILTTPLPTNYRETYKDYIYTAEVYRATSKDRNGTIEVYVPIEAIDVKHLYFHTQGMSSFYEICFPYIHRIRTNPGDTLSFGDDFTIDDKNPIVHPEYAIVGDARTKEGLAAPFEEEETKFIFKIEDSKGKTMHDFWFSNSNQDLFSTKSIVTLEVQDVKDNPTNKKPI